MHQLIEQAHAHTRSALAFLFHAKKCLHLVQTYRPFQLLLTLPIAQIYQGVYSAGMNKNAVHFLHKSCFSAKRISIRIKWVQLKCICFHFTMFIFSFSPFRFEFWLLIIFKSFFHSLAVFQCENKMVGNAIYYRSELLLCKA